MRDSVKLINHSKVMDAHDSKTERGQKFLFGLYRDHKDTMTEKFGRQTRTFTGFVRHWVWDVPFEDQTFRVFCSKRGTAYEVVYDGPIEKFQEDVKIGAKCVRFLEYMLGRFSDTKGRHDKKS